MKKSKDAKERSFLTKYPWKLLQTTCGFIMRFFFFFFFFFFLNLFGQTYKKLVADE